MSESSIKKAWIAFGIFAFALIFAAACSPADQTANVESGAKKVAVFNGGDITQGEVQQQVDALAQQSGTGSIKPGSPQYKAAVSQVMPQLVTQKLAEAYARDHGITVSQKEVSQAENNLKQQAGQQARQSGRNMSDEEAFKQVLKGYGLNEEQARQQIHDGLLVRKVQNKVVGNVKPSKAQIKDFYNKNKSRFKNPEQRCVRIIAFTPDSKKQKEQAKKVKDKIQGGGDFAELAKKYSQDPQSAKNGGKIGCVSQGQISLPPIENAIFNAKKGEIVGPVENKKVGYFLLEVTKIKPENTTSLKKVSPQIEQQLAQQQQQKKFSDWIHSQEKKRNIKYLPGYKPQGA